jgi:hypothetical protein
MSASKRTIINLVVIFSIIFLPWWAGVILIIAANVIGYFFEGIVYGAILDSMYAIQGSHTFTLIFLCFSLLVPIIKDRVRLGHK